jgi:plastocyanin
VIPNNRKNFPTVAVIIIGILIIAGVLWFQKNKPGNSQSNSEVKAEKNATVGSTDQEVKTFDLTSKPFEFSVKEIKVKKGDQVRINLKNEQGLHDWVIDEFNARTKQLAAGQSDSVEFVADKAGTFEYYCSVANHRQMGMVGKLIVE